jgi:hypothetical protein
MKTRGKTAVYHEGPEASSRFQRGLARVLSVSKEELERRELEYQESRKHKARRGPKAKRPT